MTISRAVSNFQKLDYSLANLPAKLPTSKSCVTDGLKKILYVFEAFKQLATYLFIRPFQTLARLYLCYTLQGPLKVWSQKAWSGELRHEAISRIVGCVMQQSPVLDLSNLKLTSLPECLSQLSHIQTLQASHNRLEAVSFNKLSTLPDLHTLNLSHNMMKALPNEIGLLTNLQDLDCSFNAITTISAEIRQLDKLERLNLQHNALNELDRAISCLFKLKFLDCSQNQLKEAKVVEGLYNLELLDVSYNYYLIEIDEEKIKRSCSTAKGLCKVISKTYSPQYDDSTQYDDFSELP